MKRAYLNVVLLIIVVGLGAAIFFTQKKDHKGPPLTALKADAVTHVSIAHPGKPTIELVKQGKDWTLTAPVQSPADPFEVASVVNLATQQTQRTLKDSDVKLSELKLDPPQYTITLNDQKLEFGDTDPIDHRRYVKNGKTVSLIDDPPETAVDADYSNLVSKELLPTGTQLTKIEVPGFTVSLGADGKTWTQTPATDGVTTDEISHFVSSWEGARSMWNAAMPDGADADSKGQPITLTTKDGKTVQLVLVNEKPQLTIDRPDLKVRYSLSKADDQSLLTIPPAPKKPDAKAPTAPPPTLAKPAEAPTKL
ncbi:DUF4340 domain-containing protein [Solimonas marina]|uniref:DUF4340 domain-containing protein n=1 Tax=Solimonas marina TaxID=2714601 RepID=A0A970B564_9GAMM|nr:DUF4340 domain-containing protein [Solimonas marina]NKF21215.1 DUF4340 domain-containing protein [Solimonas marina]